MPTIDQERSSVGSIEVHEEKDEPADDKHPDSTPIRSRNPSRNHPVHRSGDRRASRFFRVVAAIDPGENEGHQSQAEDEPRDGERAAPDDNDREDHPNRAEKIEREKTPSLFAHDERS